MTERATARVVGNLFIVASAAGVLGLALQQPITDAVDDLAGAAGAENRS